MTSIPNWEALNICSVLPVKYLWPQSILKTVQVVSRFFSEMILTFLQKEIAIVKKVIL